MEKPDNEKHIQNFIAKYPWLLDLKYENVPELNKNGLEYYIEGKKRTDLILRDNVTKCPVVVEFKYWNLRREDVGQILEYKARIFTSFNDENTELFRIFGNKLFTPRLVLVVRESDDFGRIACSLQNIELFEFGNMEKRIIEDIPFIKRVADFSNSLKEHSPPISEERNEYLQNNVYGVIERLFKNKGLSEKWKYYRNANFGEWCNFRNIFLDRTILPDEEVEMGIFEDIIFDKDMSVCVAYYTWVGKSDAIKEIKKKLNRLENVFKTKPILSGKLKKKISYDEEDGFECWLTVRYHYTKFFENVEEIMDYHLSNYLKEFTLK